MIRALLALVVALAGCGSITTVPWPYDPRIDKRVWDRVVAIWAPAAQLERQPYGVLVREGELDGTQVGVWRASKREIVVELFGDLELDAQFVAHEVGHSMGLGHAPQEPCALMSPNWCGADALTPVDMALALGQP